MFAALDGLPVENSDIADGAALHIAREMKDHYIDPFRVKLIGTDHAVAKAVTKIYQRYPGRVRRASMVGFLRA